ncbi:head GIN domain-containing protein [Ascidiimonas sp. W6]|uniref:head GIN domain-containing protein n=1 Tax=Ascidiimonas meishanensis TaxID=3128903 RepID=UPI0030EFA391
MKKLTTLVLILFLGTSLHAQWWGNDKVKGNGNVTTETRNTGEYDGISSAGFMNIVLVSGTEGNITIKGESNLLEYIETEVSGNNLNIKVKKGYNLKPSSGKQVIITIPVKGISKLSLAGSGTIISETTLESDDFKLSVAGSGNLKTSIEADNIKASVAGSGNITLSGKAGNMKLSIAGSGNLNATEMKVTNINASIAGSGNAKIHCDGSIKARIAGSGNLKYSGNPTLEDTKSVGSGKVIKI